MSTTVFGIDFGTTNSLAARVVGDRVLPLVDETTRRPHPSVVWYRSGEVVVGREASISRHHRERRATGICPIAEDGSSSRRTNFCRWIGN
jgi:molecular chaperone DnaK (HSP70)